jgi:hypothetical protein
MDQAHEDVARRAYELFLARGGEHGRAIDDWLEAERQLSTASLRGTGGHVPARAKPAAPRQRRRSVR